ncbi:MAG: 3' terminal RNA ribose 2'-O-methyltransferase Hen1 [Cyanobacteria bacterium SZAS TMP-1]|nr:3' terminal RNA ribose 2'-O-methyltransferase Hen1 [Cyanobacteria bacterium SZAS TMP-1]
MLLTIATTHSPATDLGFLLHKNPDNVQSFDLSFGTARVFYPEAGAERCQVALLLEVDPIGLVRRDKGSRDNMPLEQYVNDRPYVASSFFSVAIAQVFRSALSGKCEARPELVETAIPLEATVALLPCRESAGFLTGLFEPLGYEVEAVRHLADDKFREWGDSPYYTLTLRGVKRLSELLAHLYVLIPVLDNAKHYFIGPEEMEKLIRHGQGWLASHPLKEKIAHRYLRRRRSLAREALARLIDDADDQDEVEEKQSTAEEALEAGVVAESPSEPGKKITLNEQRLESVVDALKSIGARRVIDLGCGEGKLLKALWKVSAIEKMVGVDVSYRALEIAHDRLNIDELHDRQKERIELIQGSLTYKDKRMEGFDAATCIEVIEHLDPFRLTAFERVVFQYARPMAVILTTPNVEYNAKFETLPAGKLRHNDHRFEWTRAEFRSWAEAVAARYGYSVDFRPVGEEDEVLGPPTQMGVFSR